MIKGEVTGNEALFVDGNVEGAIHIPGHRVTIGRNSTVKADITAREVVVMGTVRGNIKCADLLDIRSESYLHGEIVTERIRIDDGAVLKGSVEIQRAEKHLPAKPTPAEVKKPEPPMVAAKSEAAPTAGTSGAQATAPSAIPPVLAASVPEGEAKHPESESAKALAAAVARRVAGSGGWFKSGR